MELFDKDPALHGLCVVRDGLPLGTVTRHRLHRQLGGRFGFSLFAGKTVDVVMDTNFLRVEYQTTIDRVARQAMLREDEKLYDFVVVTREGRYLGVVTVKELLEKSIELEVANAVSSIRFPNCRATPSSILSWNAWCAWGCPPAYFISI